MVRGLPNIQLQQTTTFFIIKKWLLYKQKQT